MIRFLSYNVIFLFVGMKSGNKMKIVTIVGARPQFVKAAVVSRAIEKVNDIAEVIVHTGQHFDKNMSDVFFEEMSIPRPKYNLGVHGKSHGAMTGQMLEKIEEVLLAEKPELTLVYGDTNSTLAGALASSKIHIPVVHIEAGLRSYNMKMPEEINRILSDRLSSILFCPTDTAVRNLDREGFGSFNCRIVKSGDVMQDAANYYFEKALVKSAIIKKLNLKNYVLCTIHRAENTDNEASLRSIFLAVDRIVKEIPVVIPMHPRTRKIMEACGINTKAVIIDPIGYFDMIMLLKNCSLVMTDSGGVQKEAFFFGKHCVTMRGETEWIELVEGGYNVLSGFSSDTIYQCFTQMIMRNSDFTRNLYGNGSASEVIAQELSMVKR